MNYAILFVLNFIYKYIKWKELLVNKISGKKDVSVFQIKNA